MSTLKVTSGPAAGQTLELESRVVLGREGADVTIADPEMSRRHAELRPMEAGVEIEDLGSMNGTFVDGKRIEGAQAHTATFELRLGQSEMVVEIPPPPPPVETEPQEIADPNVTVARPVPGEKVSDPERTAIRGVVPPIDPTVVRPTAQPGGAPPPAPGGAPPPAPGGAPAPAPGGAPQAGGLPPLPPPPAGAPAQAPAPVQKEGRSGPPRALLIIALVVAVAVVVAILVFLIL